MPALTDSVAASSTTTGKVKPTTTHVGSVSAKSVTYARRQNLTPLWGTLTGGPAQVGGFLRPGDSP